jgi:hypothetical protein
MVSEAADLGAAAARKASSRGRRLLAFEGVALGELLGGPQAVAAAAEALPLDGGELEAVADLAGLALLGDPALEGAPVADEGLVGDLVDGAVLGLADDDEAAADEGLEGGLLGGVAE